MAKKEVKNYLRFGPSQNVLFGIFNGFFHMFSFEHHSKIFSVSISIYIMFSRVMDSHAMRDNKKKENLSIEPFSCDDT